MTPPFQLRFADVPAAFQAGQDDYASDSQPTPRAQVRVLVAEQRGAYLDGQRMATWNCPFDRWGAVARILQAAGVDVPTPTWRDRERLRAQAQQRRWRRELFVVWPDGREERRHASL